MKEIEKVILNRVERAVRLEADILTNYLLEEYALNPAITAMLYSRLIDFRELKVKIEGRNIFLMVGAFTPEEEADFKRESARLNEQIMMEIKAGEEEAKLEADKHVPKDKKYYN